MSAPSKGNLLGGPVAPLAIVGVGLVSPSGFGVEALLQALLERRCCLSVLPSAVRPGAIDRSEPADIGGRVALAACSGFHRASSLAIAAASEALEQAKVRAGRISLSVGTALGESGALEREVEAELGPLKDPAVSLVSCDSSVDAFVGEIRGKLQSTVPGATWLSPGVFSVTCVSGLCALEQAAADLAFDRSDHAVVGGVDVLSRFMHSGFKALGALSPSGRIRPFDVHHDGILIGEAAAFLVLEPVRRARARDRNVLGCIVSQRLVSDACHLTSPDPEGRGMARAISGAMSDAGLNHGELGGVTFTAVGSAVYDRMLSRALIEALGKNTAERLPVSSWESATGHLLAATGALGYVHGVMALCRGFLDPLWGFQERDPECRLRYVIDRPEPLAAPSVLALTVGFGGQNGAAVITSESLAADLMARKRSRSLGEGGSS